MAPEPGRLGPSAPDERRRQRSRDCGDSDSRASAPPWRRPYLPPARPGEARLANTPPSACVGHGARGRRTTGDRPAHSTPAALQARQHRSSSVCPGSGPDPLRKVHGRCALHGRPTGDTTLLQGHVAEERGRRPHGPARQAPQPLVPQRRRVRQSGPLLFSVSIDPLPYFPLTVPSPVPRAVPAAPCPAPPRSWPAPPRPLLPRQTSLPRRA